MKIFKSEQVREADAFTIKKEPISSINLMERAAKKASTWIKQNFSKNTKVAILVGPGNNGGDGLVVARHLLESGFHVQVFDLEISNNYSSDFLINKTRLQKFNNGIFIPWTKNINLSQFDLIIDAILGSGLTRPITGNLAQIIQTLNQSSIKTIAIDIPSGLFGEDNSKNNHQNIVKANYTLTFQFPKLAFLLPENTQFVGKMEVFDIGVHPQYIENTATNFYLTQKENISTHFLHRELFSHKGSFGHALLVSGSKGKMGAAILAAKACLRSGVGLLSTFVPKEENIILQIAVPEVMTISNLDEIDIQNFISLGIGPGLGQSEASLELLIDILKIVKTPLVVDADALNLLAAHPQYLDLIPKGSIFTPHPKELERLIGKTSNHYLRLFKTLELAQKYQIYILIKGAYSVIVSPDGNFHFNSTGNPGMATAGSGDVLTGIITALLAQGLSSFEALQTAVFIHGLSGDLAKKDKGEIALIASDIIDNIGESFKQFGI